MNRVHQKLDPAKTGQDAVKLRNDLRDRIVGQDEAVNQIVNIYQSHRAGMSAPGRPIGNFLFLGPTGTGKTRLVEATAESLLGDAKSIVKIDCSEFQHSHEIAKLIGSPPGYLGHRETHALLSQEMLNQHHTDKIKVSLVLFDEIEKASDSLWNLLLGILDKAALTLGDNRKVDFSRAMIFMTSNLGAAEISSILRPRLGFTSQTPETGGDGGVMEKDVQARISRAAVEAAKRKFTPEFMNRIDKTVVFKPLGLIELQRILDLELASVQARILRATGSVPFVFKLNRPAKNFLLQEGTDLKYGARHLRRVVERSLMHPLSNLIASGQIRPGDLVTVGLDGDQLTFVREAESLPDHILAQFGLGETELAPAPAAAAAAREISRPAVARSQRSR